MILVYRLKRFGKKYYSHLFLQRLLIFLVAAFFILFILSFFEYSFWFSTGVRIFIFYVYLIALFFLFFIFLLTPLYHLFKIFIKPDYEHLIKLVSKSYPELHDPLLNLVYIYYNKYVAVSQSLLEISIKERTDKLSIYRIEDIIPFKRTISLVLLLTFTMLTLVFLTYKLPNKYLEPFERIFNYNTEYIQPFPYTIDILNPTLYAPAFTDFNLRFKIFGSNIPEEIFVVYQGQYHPVFYSDGVYSVMINLKDKDIPFQILVGNHLSSVYNLKVINTPRILQTIVVLDFPSYLKKNAEKFENFYEFTVPRGTNAKISFLAKYADVLLFNFSNQLVEKQFSYNVVSVDYKCLESNSITFYAYNRATNFYDSVTISFQVIPDLNPVIEVKESIDSIEFWKRFFNIRISDDYGLSKLTFHVNYDIDTMFAIPIKSGSIEQEISTSFDFSIFLSLMMGKSISYYFKVCDNDMLYGGKCTKSKTFHLKVPSTDELDNINQQLSSQISNNISKQSYQPEFFNDRINKLIEEMLNTKNLDWQQKQKFNNLLDEERQFQQNLQDIYNQFQQMMNLNNVFSQDNPYQHLQKLLEQIKDNNLQQLLDEIKKLLEENKFDQLRNKLEQLKEQNQILKDMLDQMDYLYKKTYVEENLKNIQSKMNELSVQQEELSKEKSLNESDKQKAIEEEYKNVLQKMDSVLKFNEQIDNLFNLDSIYQSMKELEKELQNLSHDINSKNTSVINQRQKKSAEDMKNIADDIEKIMNEQLQEQQAEDEANLIQLLKYLVKVSFDQERVFKTLNSVKTTDPSYYDVIKQQKQIEDHLQIITDSLTALGKRNPLIDKKIREEIVALQSNRRNVLNFLNQRNIPQVMRNQQFIMMRVNNLALMLAEILKQMQEQNQNNMNSAMKIKSSCKKPGTSSQNKPQPNPTMIRKLQEELNKQVEQLKEQMNNGKPGDKLNEQFARLSLQQEIIRKAMQQYLENLKGQGEKNTQQIQKIIDDMEKNEVDLINKKLNEQTIYRLQDIMVRLLESEKAELQRELDPNRVSQTAKNINNGNPFTKIEYKEVKKQIYENMKTVPLQFNSFYRQKVGEYYQKYR